MAVPVIIPELQFIDADGHPYAGGTLETYITGTTTPKATWVDPEQAALNPNPIVLDAAGRCLCWGDGEYRLILRDSAGNLVWDQPATTIVSAAMAPVVAAPTIADALELLGINDLIAAEAAARNASDAAEQAARIAADNAEKAAREAADANLQSQIDTINATIAALPGPSTGQFPLWGYAYSDSDGHKRITYGAAFPSGSIAFVQCVNATYSIIDATVLSDASGFDVWFAFPMTTGTTPAGVQEFSWMALGS